VQIRATDGIVNFYLPGYLRTGLSASLSRVGTSIKGKFTDTNDQVIDPYVSVRPEAITALGVLARAARLWRRGRMRRARWAFCAGRAAAPDLISSGAFQEYRLDLRIADRAPENPR